MRGIGSRDQTLTDIEHLVSNNFPSEISSCLQLVTCAGKTQGNGVADV